MFWLIILKVSTRELTEDERSTSSTREVRQDKISGVFA